MEKEAEEKLRPGYAMLSGSFKDFLFKGLGFIGFRVLGFRV